MIVVRSFSKLYQGVTTRNKKPRLVASSCIKGCKVGNQMKISQMTAIGASVTAFFGSCCALPLLLLGLTGTVGFTSVLAPYQKYFTIGTIILLGTAFYLVYGRKQQVCLPAGKAGENPKLCSPRSQGLTKILLWISTALAAIFLIGPHLIAP